MRPKVLFVVPNPRKMSLVPPIVPLFYSIFKQANIEMRYFDTSLYDVSDKYIDTDKAKQNFMIVKNFEQDFFNKHLEKRTHKDMLFDFEALFNQYSPDVFMFSVLESTWEFTKELLNQIYLGSHIVLGGVFPTFAPEICLKHHKVNIICRGEGEKVIVPLVKKLKKGESLKNIPNIWYKPSQFDGAIEKNRLGKPVDINDNPPFDITPIRPDRFFRAMAGKIYWMFPIETHRGCTNACGFCNSPLQNRFYSEETKSIFFRKKKISLVLRDLRYAKEQGAEYIFFWADNFMTYTLEEIEEFADGYSKINIPFYAQTHPNNIDKDKFRLLKEVGLHRIGMGIEHGNEKFRAEVINRHYKNKDVIRDVKVMKKLKIPFSCNNIVGFPTETPQLHLDTIGFNRKIKPDTASCSIFMPFHGTPLRELGVKMGYMKDSIIAPTSSEQSVLDMPQFTKKQIYGKARCFNLYLKFPKDRWEEIGFAETSDEWFERLKKESATS